MECLSSELLLYSNLIDRKTSASNSPSTLLIVYDYLLFSINTTLDTTYYNWLRTKPFLQWKMGKKATKIHCNWNAWAFMQRWITVEQWSNALVLIQCIVSNDLNRDWSKLPFVRQFVASLSFRVQQINVCLISRRKTNRTYDFYYDLLCLII